MATVSVPELCLICYQALSSRKLNRRKFASSEQIVEAFSVDVVFTLKSLLQIPEELFERFVGSCGGKVPGTWISLCDGCIEGVVEAKMIYQEIWELSRKFKSVQDKVVDKLKRSCEDEDKRQGSSRKKAKLDQSLSVTDECRKCVNERIVSASLQEEPFLVEDVTAFTRRLCGRLSVPDNFGIAAQTFIILPPAIQPIVQINPPIFKDVHDDLLLEEVDQHDPLGDSDEDDKDPLSISDLGFNDAGTSNDLEDATDESVVDLKEDLEIKPEAASSPENSDCDSQQDEMSSVSSEAEDSPEEDEDSSEVKSISRQLVLDPDNCTKCPTCQKEFKSLVGLKAHLRQIHKVKILEPEKVRPCPEPNCNLTFTDYREYYHHLRCHKRGPPKHKCSHCERTFFDPKGLRNHTKSVHDITLPPNRIRPPTLECPQCPKMLHNVLSMRHHMLTTHQTEYIPEPEKSFPCNWPNCGKILSNPETLRVHISRHEKNPIFNCDLCEERFYTHDLRRQHRESFHKDDKPRTITNSFPKIRGAKDQQKYLQCDLCGKQYSSRGSLQTHRQFQHEKDFKIRCSICNQGMVNNSSLKVHMVRTHKVSGEESGELPQCPVVGCREVFSTKQLLDRHMARVHGESGTELRFQCSHCGKGFQNKFKFEQHEMIHLNGETKPFKCDLCGKGFANQAYLRYHQLHTHKAERKLKRRKEIMPRSILNRKTDKPSK